MFPQLGNADLLMVPQTSASPSHPARRQLLICVLPQIGRHCAWHLPAQVPAACAQTQTPAALTQPADSCKWCCSQVATISTCISLSKQVAACFNGNAVRAANVQVTHTLACNKGLAKSLSRPSGEVKCCCSQQMRQQQFLNQRTCLLRGFTLKLDASVHVLSCLAGHLVYTTPQQLH